MNHSFVGHFVSLIAIVALGIFFNLLASQNFIPPQSDDPFCINCDASLHANYTEYVTSAFNHSESALYNSDVWEPTLCDTTSLVGQNECLVYIAGRWKTVIQPESTSTLLTADATARIRKCRVSDKLNLTNFVYERGKGLVSSKCSLSAQDLRTALLERARLKLVRNRYNVTMLVFSGDSIVRSIQAMLVHLLRGTPSIIDRGSHHRISYVVTTTGDFFFFSDGKDQYSADSVLEHAERITGGERLLFVDYYRTCKDPMSMTDALGSINLYESSDVVVTSCLGNFESASTYRFKREFETYSRELEDRLLIGKRAQTVVLLDHNTHKLTYCWNSRILSKENRGCTLSNQYKSTFARKYQKFLAKKSADNGAQLLILPLYKLKEKSGIVLRDALHGLTIISPKFPSRLQNFFGEPWSSQNPDLTLVTMQYLLPNVL